MRATDVPPRPYEAGGVKPSDPPVPRVRGDGSPETGVRLLDDPAPHGALASAGFRQALLANRGARSGRRTSSDDQRHRARREQKHLLLSEDSYWAGHCGDAPFRVPELRGSRSRRTVPICRLGGTAETTCCDERRERRLLNRVRDLQGQQESIGALQNGPFR